MRPGWPSLAQRSVPRARCGPSPTGDAESYLRAPSLKHCGTLCSPTAMQQTLADVKFATSGGLRSAQE